MQETEKRQILPEKENRETKGYPWELVLLVGSLVIGVILLGLKAAGII